MSQIREEAVVELGLNTSKIQSQLSQFGSTFKSKLSGFTSNFAGYFASGAIVAGISKIIDKFDDLQDRAENLGVSTDFLQGMQHISSKDAVGGVESFNKAISELSNKLGAAKQGGKEAVAVFQKYGITLENIRQLDAEAMFYKISHQIKATHDPALRVNEAFELMGKSGKNMVGVLANGSAELKKFVDEADKLSEAKIAMLGEAKSRIQDLQNQAITGGGIMLGGVSDFINWLGEKSAGGNPGNEKALREKARLNAQLNHAANRPLDTTAADYDKQLKLQSIYRELAEVTMPKLQKLKREEADLLYTTRNLSISEEDRLKAHVDLAKKRLEISKEEASIQKDMTEQQKKQFELADRKRRDLEEFMPGVGDLRRSSKFGKTAIDISMLERSIKQDFLAGDTAKAGKDIAERNRLYDTLSDAGVVRRRESRDKIEEATLETAAAVKKIASFIPNKK